MALEELINELKEMTNDSEQTESHLVLYNDNVNSVDFVVQTLELVCRHTDEQALQCALQAHYKGKSIARSGTKKELYPMLLGLQNRNLTAEII